MKAAVIEQIGAQPVYRDFPEPQRDAGQSLIRVTAAPLNPVDLAIAAGRFQGVEPTTPYVAGREAVGEVLESDTLTPGTRVYMGGTATMAQLAVAADSELVRLPDDVDDALAACFGVAGLAAWLGLDWRGGLQPGEKVLILAASGAVGMIATQGAKLLGAGRVIAAARSERGLERARQLGADATVRLDHTDDLSGAFTQAAQGQIDLTIDPLWGEPAQAAVAASAPNGRLVQIGRSASERATFESGTVRGRQLSILGLTIFYAPPEIRSVAYTRMLAHAGAGELTVDHEVFELQRVADVWKLQEASPNRKLVLRPN